MKRLFLSILAGMLLVTGCAKPEEPGYPMDGDGMARKPYLEIDQEQAKHMMETEADLVILDVRRQDEFDAGHIPGAVCIPNETIGTEPIDALGDFAQTILVYCRSGNRSKQAAEKLGKMGYTHVYEFGGILDWTGEIVTETPKDGTVDLDDYIGVYGNGNNDSVILIKTDAGYEMTVSLYGLALLEEGTVSASGEGIVFHTAGDVLGPMTLLFCQSGDAYALKIEKSTWQRLEEGTVISGFIKTADTLPVEQGDLIDPADLFIEKESHYSFQPKICSGYMEDIFGEDMREAWFHLVDAVMAGEDTFACKDQYTYDWVMGQFPDRLLPILPQLIDYAWDREHSVKDGIASFTYLVPVEEAQARIIAFGEQVEGILNSVLEDDYSDVEKALALYEYFSKTYEYDYDTYRKMYETYVDYLSSYRFFETGTGVCQEISTAYSYLLLQAGVDATIMMGEAHQWSYVRINGHHYHIDPTFVLNDKDALSYFLMNDEQREVTGFGKDSFIIASVYTQDHPHPDYLANDDTFRPVWNGYLEAFFPEENRMLIRKSSDFGETYHVEFDYTGF